MTDTQRGVQQFIGAMQGVVERMMPRDRWIEVGRIRADYALVILDSVQSVDDEPLVFKIGEYQVLRHLCAGLGYLTTTPNGTATRDPSDPNSFVFPGPDGGHGGHTSGDGTHWHQVLTPPPLDTLVPGDVVEVHWLSGYSDPIVAGAIVTSRSLPGAIALGLVPPVVAPTGAPEGD